MLLALSGSVYVGRFGKRVHSALENLLTLGKLFTHSAVTCRAESSPNYCHVTEAVSPRQNSEKKKNLSRAICQICLLSMLFLIPSSCIRFEIVESFPIN